MIKKLGRIWFAGHACWLCFDTESGGASAAWPENRNLNNEDNLMTVTVGYACGNLDHAHAALMHEFVEVSLDLDACRFNRSSRFTRASDACIFVFDHVQLHEMCACVSNVMGIAWPMVKKAILAFEKEEKAKKKQSKKKGKKK